MPKTEAPSETRIERRKLFAGAGAVGALAGAAAVLPLARRPEADAAAKPAPEAGGGYQVTQHVLRYYETTRV